MLKQEKKGIEPELTKKIKSMKIDDKVMNDIKIFERNLFCEKNNLEGQQKRVPRKYKKRPRTNQAFNLYSIRPRVLIMKKMQEKEASLMA